MGTLKQAKAEARTLKYEPLKHIQALENALVRGAGLSLDQHVPGPVSPNEMAANRSLENKGAIIFVSDQEGKQFLSHVSAKLLYLSNPHHGIPKDISRKYFDICSLPSLYSILSDI